MMLSPKLKSKCQRFISKAVIYILLSCLGFVIIYPLFGRVMLSIMDEYDLYDDTVRFFTRRLNFGNYSLAIHYMNYWDSLFKTVIYVLTAGICQLFSSVVIGYGMARFKFFGNRLLFMFLLLSLIVPPHLISLPLSSVSTIKAAGQHILNRDTVLDGSGSEKRFADIYNAAVFQRISERT